MAHNISEEKRRDRALEMRPLDWSRDMGFFLGCRCGHKVTFRMGGIAQDYPHVSFAGLLLRLRCRHCFGRVEVAAIMAPATHLRRNREVVIVLRGQEVLRARRIAAGSKDPFN